MTYRVAVYQPSHFHAALCLRAPNARLSPDIHVYATPGPERDAFVALVETFNQRSERATHWRLILHEGDDPLGRLIDDGNSDFVILANRNHQKLATIAVLSDAGLPVLADKPWLTDSAQLSELEKVTTADTIAMDLMTIRHELLARLGHQLARSPALFGEFQTADDEPAIDIASIHHLYKKVNAKPLRRPPWYYDIALQGDGLVDIQSHMVEQAQWWVLDEDGCDFNNDMTLIDAERNTTAVPLELFRDSTGEQNFPESLSEAVHDNVLQYACNGRIDYRLRGITVRQSAEWRQREPEGGGDMHAVSLRGSRCRLLVRQGPQTAYRAEVHLEPADVNDSRFEADLKTHIPQWQQRFPGLDYEPSGPGYRFLAPADLDHGHESHFPLVLNRFLDILDRGRLPDSVKSRIRSRYTLLARARERALSKRTVS